jgi:hypothetical protein
MVCDEELYNGRWVNRYWTATGQIKPEFSSTRSGLPEDSFQLGVEGQDLAGSWKWIKAEKQALTDPDGLLITVWFQSTTRPISVKLHTLMHGGPVMVRWLEITNTGTIGASVGADEFVIDAGWYGPEPNRWAQNVGDWYAGAWLPNDITPIREYGRSKRMLFGLWMEPESIGSASKLRQQPRLGIDTFRQTVRHWKGTGSCQPAVAKWVESEIVRIIQKYYYHAFYKEQPDLNWRDKDVRNAMFDVTRFWMRRGVAGFRLDAVTSLVEDIALKDEPYLAGMNAYCDRNISRLYNLPQVHQALRELRRVINEFPGRVLIGETYVHNAGASLIYYGEELGMMNNDPKRKQDVKDPVGKLGWPKEKGRDGERTPMQWNNDVNAGFSSAKSTWLPVGPDYKTVNVAAEEHERDSLLNYYKTLIRLRKENPQLRDGDFVPVDQNNSSVLSYPRKTKNGRAALVALNFTPAPQILSFDFQPQSVQGKHTKTLLASFSTGQSDDLGHIVLPPYGAYVGEVEP